MPPSGGFIFCFNLDLYIIFLEVYEMHIYANDDKSICLPSVTTIISFIKTKNEYEPLLKWSNTLGYSHKDYTATLDYYATFGTIVHETLSHIVTGKYTPDDLDKKVGFSDMEKYLMTITNFLSFYNNTNPDTIYSEKSFLSENLGYGGTIDWVSKENNDIILTDFKTSSAIRDYMLLQLCAYMKLLEENTDIRISHGRIMLVSTKTFTTKTYSRDVLESYWEKFSLIFRLYQLYNPSIDIDSSENSLIIV